MTTEIKNVDGVFTAFLSGRLETGAAFTCREDLQPLFDHADKTVAVDCTNLEYVSSSGLRIFMELLQQTKTHGGQLKIVNVTDNVRRVFALTGFDKKFEI